MLVKSGNYAASLKVFCVGLSGRFCSASSFLRKMKVSKLLKEKRRIFRKYWLYGFPPAVSAKFVLEKRVRNSTKKI